MVALALISCPFALAAQILNLKIQYTYLAFDHKGRLREDERERASRLSMDGSNIDNQALCK
jgi:hypothetical protein